MSYQCSHLLKYYQVSFFLRVQLTLFKEKVYNHQVLIYLNAPGIPVKKPFQNGHIVEEQLDM